MTTNLCLESTFPRLLSVAQFNFEFWLVHSLKYIWLASCDLQVEKLRDQKLKNIFAAGCKALEKLVAAETRVDLSNTRLAEQTPCTLIE